LTKIFFYDSNSCINGAKTIKILENITIDKKPVPIINQPMEEIALNATKRPKNIKIRQKT